MSDTYVTYMCIFSIASPLERSAGCFIRWFLCKKDTCCHLYNLGVWTLGFGKKESINDIFVDGNLRRFYPFIWVLNQK